jgi:hypothetical protein
VEREPLGLDGLAGAEDGRDLGLHGGVGARDDLADAYEGSCLRHVRAPPAPFRALLLAISAEAGIRSRRRG